jgi:membrane protease YdiL (CAAX protease family)
MVRHLSGGNLDEDMLTTESSPPAIPQPPKRGVHWVFFGADGIRAGWGVLLFVLLYVVFIFFTGWVLRPFFREARHLTVLPLRLALITEFAQFLPTVLATAILALIERRSLLAYGYQGKAKAVRFVSGLVWGFVALSVFVFVLWKARLLAFDGELLHGSAILKYALGWGLMFLIVAFFEESTLRGYLQFTLTRGIGFWWGALLLSLLFGFGHGTNPGETPVGLFSAAGIGLVFCISLWYTGSLWWAVGFHASWDWAESYFYGTSDSGMVIRGHLLGEHPIGSLLWSGGATGPEGSILILALIVIIALLMWLWWGRRVQSPFISSGWRPAWSRRPALDNRGPRDPESLPAAL